MVVDSNPGPSKESVVADVVVVGAGPAGLMLASNLVRYGINPAIIDDRPHQTRTGRADGLQPKSIETLRQFRLADTLLQKGVRIYDICFWSSTPDTPLRRTARETHYPPEVDVIDPYILLVHQGMLEDVFIEDLTVRGVNIIRNAKFAHLEPLDQMGGPWNIFVENPQAEAPVPLGLSRFIVGCDGAHSKVRRSIYSIRMEGENSNAAWGVLDGVIETDFPDLWHKVVIHSETEGTVLCIPRERNMTRLYIELDQDWGQDKHSEDVAEGLVMDTARRILAPFTLKWTSVEWFSVYRVGQRVASDFVDETQTVFITGDASHTHSPKAAQGMNTSIHDSLNLAWKLNLAIRGLAKPCLLESYSSERRKIAQDLIRFDLEHANAFAAGDPVALARNFSTHVGFIAGTGVTYPPNELNVPESSPRQGTLQAGHLLTPAKVLRYIDSNPVDIQLDIPMLGQFRIYFFVSDIHAASNFLSTVCAHLASPLSLMGRLAHSAAKSYESKRPAPVPNDAFIQPERYTAYSELFTLALVTTAPASVVEISDLPHLMQKSRWTFYLDGEGSGGNATTCTSKWLGGVDSGTAAIVNVRPDGYVGNVGRFVTNEIKGAEDACSWLDEYYGAFLHC